MKHILTILFIAGAFYWSSCTKNDTPINAPVILPKADSVSVGDSLQLSFAGKSFTITDLTVINSPVYSLFGKTQAFDQYDTLWIAQIQMTDHQSKTISLNLTAYNNTSGTSTGTYLVRDNTCTVTDFSEGQNKNYAVAIGSSISITDTFKTLRGILSLNLYYDHNYYPATGSFKIYK